MDSKLAKVMIPDAKPAAVRNSAATVSRCFFISNPIIYRPTRDFIYNTLGMFFCNRMKLIKNSFFLPDRTDFSPRLRMVIIRPRYLNYFLNKPLSIRGVWNFRTSAVENFRNVDKSLKYVDKMKNRRDRNNGSGSLFAGRRELQINMSRGIF